jgi:ubiquinone biosynthesis protein
MPRADERARARNSIRERLEAFGFRATATVRRRLGERRAGARMRAALHGLGPVFQSFGLYLSTRLDLLPARDAFELSRLEADIPPSPLSDVEEQIRIQARAAPDTLFRHIEEEPTLTTPCYLWHEAQSHDGQQVTLKIVRPELARRLAPDLALLAEASRQLKGPGWQELDDEVLEDFRGQLESQLDLEAEAYHELDLERREQRPPGLRLARVVPALSFCGVLATRRLAGRPATVVEEIPSRTQAAHRLALAWLEEAVLGRWQIASPLGGNLLILNDGAVAARGGLTAAVGSRAQRAVRDYLLAVHEEDPDRACRALLGVCQPPEDGSTPDEDTLRHQFRQAEPFRLGTIAGGSAAARIADLLFLHWHLLRQHGLRLEPGLLPVIRGLTELEWLTRRLAPDEDTLATALEDLQLIRLAVQVRELFAPSQWKGRIGRLLPALEEIRDHLDRLPRDGGGETRDAVETKATPSLGGDFLALLLALIAVPVLAQRLVAAQAGAWVEPSFSCLFLGLAALLLWRVARGG